MEEIKMEEVGSHIEKIKTYHNTLCNIINILESQGKNIKNYPIQIFTGNNKSFKRISIESQLKDIELSKNYIKEKNIKCFIHSSYIINLSRTFNEIKEGIEYLKYELKLGSLLNILGVVVHVGKSLKMDKKIAENNMFNNIKLMLEFIDKSCPLIIETPAGQGTEILTNIDDFMNFYDRFDINEKEKIKICIDTCHVFSSNVDPIDYILKFTKKFSNALVLVHLNDSKCEKGSKKDRHAYPGDGYIGKKLDEVILWCNNNKIPMIIE